MTAIINTNNINGQSSEGMVGANDCDRSMYIISDSSKSINEGSYSEDEYEVDKEEQACLFTSANSW
jgi:hypothetical protein